MFRALIAVAFAVAVIGESKPAYAIAACNNNFGFAPRKDTVLPPRARVIAYDEGHSTVTYAAKIDGKTVPIKVTDIKSAPYVMHQIEIDSDKTGTLVIYQVFDKKEFELTRYKVDAKTKMPADVKITTRRFTKDIQHSTVKETYNALALDVGDAPAIMATIKIKRDPQVQWNDAWSVTTFQAPVSSGDWVDKSNAIRIGELGCVQNYTASLLKAGSGAEIQATVLLVDGSTRAFSTKL